jgi:thymidine kinase
LFKAPRGKGKTTVLLCEAKRFAEHGFDVQLISKDASTREALKRQYHDLIGEWSNNIGFRSQTQNLREIHSDVVLIDDVDYTDDFEQFLLMSPMFIRATSSLGSAKNYPIHFDSVYEV